MSAGIAVLATVLPVTAAWTTVVTDSGYFVRGAAQPAQALLAVPNCDLWEEWHRLVAMHEDRVVLVKVPPSAPESR